MFSRYIHTLKQLSSIKHKIPIKKLSDNLIYNPFTGKSIKNVNPMLLGEIVDNFFPETKVISKKKSR